MFTERLAALLTQSRMSAASRREPGGGHEARSQFISALTSPVERAFEFKGVCRTDLRISRPRQGGGAPGSKASESALLSYSVPLVSKGDASRSYDVPCWCEPNPASFVQRAVLWQYKEQSSTRQVADFAVMSVTSTTCVIPQSNPHSV